jgi:hypothetical protein
VVMSVEAFGRLRIGAQDERSGLIEVPVDP